MENTNPIFVHSPKSHYHSQTAASLMESRRLDTSRRSGSRSDTGSKSDTDSNNSDVESKFSGSGESDVSDMIVENKSRFDNLNKQRRKSGGSEYHPASDSNKESSTKSKSEPESDSEESESESSCIEPSKATLLKNKRSPSVRNSEEDSEGTSSRSTSHSLSHPAKVKRSPVVRKAPLGLGQRSSPSDVTMMRGYRYSMLPSRTAAMNVSYSRYLAADEEDSDNSLTFSRNGKGRLNQRTDSDSEFEVPGVNDDGSSEEEASFDEESEEEYYPAKRKSGGARRRKV